ILRQHMGLLVGDHLDCMLDTPQKPVLSGECIARVLRDPAIACELSEHGNSLSPPQLGKTPASYELLGLHEELDLADAAAPELDVVAFHGDFAMPLMGMDLALYGVNVRDRSVVHVFAPDIGAQLFQEGFAGGNIASYRARLDH